VSDDLLLDADEELLWSGRPRLSAAAGAVLGGSVLVVFGGAGLLSRGFGGEPVAVALSVLLVILGVAVPVHRVLALRRTRYAVSDRALYARSGVLSVSVRRMGLDRVQNSAYGQSVLGGVFGYGTVTAESAGGGPSVTFSRIERPREVRSLVDRRVSRLADPVPGTAEQWEAVLGDIRALRDAVVRRGGLG
jgi:uncharacterized membrane protein YdbT with pleckstrin-like domain